MNVIKSMYPNRSQHIETLRAQHRSDSLQTYIITLQPHMR
jgi:hypothetical protein